MTKPRHASALAPIDPRLARTLWQCLALGLLALALAASARGAAWSGPGALWLLLAPLSSLLVCYRHVFGAAWRRVLVPAPRRRRTARAGMQASRLAVRSSPARARQHAA